LGLETILTSAAVVSVTSAVVAFVTALWQQIRSARSHKITVQIALDDDLRILVYPNLRDPQAREELGNVIEELSEEQEKELNEPQQRQLESD
jgi:hypothetical protein